MKETIGAREKHDERQGLDDSRYCFDRDDIRIPWHERDRGAGALALQPGYAWRDVRRGRQDRRNTLSGGGVAMSDAGRFLIYCIEMYRRAKQISGRAAYELFRSVGADEYVRRCYGALHTTGEQYILADIDGYIGSVRKAN